MLNMAFSFKLSAFGFKLAKAVGLRLLGGFHPLRGAFMLLFFLFCVEATDGHIAENGAGIGGEIL